MFRTSTGAIVSLATSRAAVLVEPGNVEVREFPLPATRLDDGLLRIEAAGVCGSDVGAYRGPIPRSFYEPPCVIGHELVGRVERIGDDAAERWGVREGDRIVVEEYLPCGTCASCLAGAYQMCQSAVMPRYGGTSVDRAPSLWGAFSDFMYLHPQSIVHRVDDQTPPQLLQLYIPISNGLHWVQEVGGGRAGSTVVVIGPGPHGLGCVIGARETGAGLIILIGQDRDVARLDAGRLLGADHTLTGNAEAITAALADLTDDAMADVVINVANSVDALDLAVAVAGNRATIVQAGLAHGDGGSAGRLSHALVDRLLVVRGVRGRPSTAVRPALNLIASGRYALECMCTGTFGVDQVEQAIQAVIEDSAAIRSVVVPDGLVGSSSGGSTDRHRS